MIETDMYLVSTTNGWNLGDDLIREGVLNILPIDGCFVWLNRNQIDIKDEKFDWTPLWKIKRSMNPVNDYMNEAKGFVLAGTPEWITTLRKPWKLAIEHDVPIYIVGVGMKQRESKNVLSRAKHLIVGATVRDRYASESFDEVDIQHEWHFEPGFFADYPNKRKNDLVIFTPLLETEKEQAYYAKLYSRFRDIIDLIVVHMPCEYIAAKRMFEHTIFFDSNYQKYKDVYDQCRIYIGGRSHGAVPVLAQGGDAYLVKHKTKQQMAEMWVRNCGCNNPPIHVVSGEDFEIDLNPESDKKGFRQSLVDDFISHRKYWEKRI